MNIKAKAVKIQFVACQIVRRTGYLNICSCRMLKSLWPALGPMAFTLKAQDLALKVEAICSYMQGETINSFTV